MKLICIGRNYPKHIKELQNEKPTEPVFFLKPDSAILSKRQAFYIPDFSDDIQYETEVLVKICKVGKHIAEKFSPKYYTEIGLGIDFTARDLQTQLKKKGLPWEKAKAFDGSAFVSKFVPKNSFENINNIRFSLKKNDVVVQSGNTADMLWNVDELISYTSRFLTLKIGDILFTGTPQGVGSVKPGDCIEGFLEAKPMFRLKIK